MRNKSIGFTIVELLITIVVISILATTVTVAFNGIQQRARDSQRISDIKTISKALELYYIDNGEYPTITNGAPCVNENGVSRSTCPNWTELKQKLSPYTSALPVDPINKGGSTGDPSQHSYFYQPRTNQNNASLGCSASQTNQSYTLTYFPEEPSKFTNEYIGTCMQSLKPGTYYNTNYARGYFLSHP